LYAYDSSITHIGVPETAETKLRAMAQDLVGTEDLVAIYIPESTEDVYEPGATRGRVVGGVRLLPMPSGNTMRDYFYRDWDESMRWPIGWPCKAVYAPDVSQCRALRSLVDELFGPQSFQPYVGRFQLGPFELERPMANRLDSIFAGFSKLP
jgi:hypothetical protein